MKDWMNITELSGYLDIPESRIRLLIKQKGIPFSDRLGEARFNKAEIDGWMKESAPQEMISWQPPEGNTEYLYRGTPINHYKLAGSLVLSGKAAWMRLPDFIEKTVARAKEVGSDYLCHEEFKLMTNYNDYLRICCQLGLIENLRGEGRKKHYYLTEFAWKIASEKSPEKIKRLILESILSIVQKNMEKIPSERYAIMLLWYILKIKGNEIDPDDSYFRVSSDKPNNHYPRIRLGFALSLCYFLFGDDKDEEQEFLAEWEKLL